MIQIMKNYSTACMGNKFFVVLWQCILVFGSLILMSCWIAHGKAHELPSTILSFFNIISNPFDFYYTFLFLEDSFFKNGSLLPFLPAVFAIFMACLSLIAWNKKPNLYTMLSTVIGVWGMCGIPYAMLLDVFHTGFLFKKSMLDIDAYWNFNISCMLFYIIPSLFILYHFCAIFQKKDKDSVNISSQFINDNVTMRCHNKNIIIYILVLLIRILGVLLMVTPFIWPLFMVWHTMTFLPESIADYVEEFGGLPYPHWGVKYLLIEYITSPIYMYCSPIAFGAGLWVLLYKLSWKNILTALIVVIPWFLVLYLDLYFGMY